MVSAGVSLIQNIESQISRKLLSKGLAVFEKFKVH